MTRILHKEKSNIRYGVFLEPTERLRSEVLSSYEIADKEFGFISAKAYEPHVTLVGSIALAPESEESELVEALEEALYGRRAPNVWTSGMQIRNDSIEFPVVDDPHARTPGALAALMGAILNAAAPLRVFYENDFSVKLRLKDSPENFRGHLSVVSFDGKTNPEGVKACFRRLRAEGWGEPGSWRGENVVLYRFTSQNWTGEYWHTMTSERITSWTLTA